MSLTLSDDALKLMLTPLIMNAPAPLPPSETAVARLADARLPVILTAPSAEVLVIVPLPLLYNFAACRKLLLSVALPRTIGLLLLSEIVSVVES